MSLAPRFTEAFGDRLPSRSEMATANQLRQILAAQQKDGAPLKVTDDRGRTSEILLAPALAQVLLELLRHIGRGDAVTLMPVSQMLTTQQAADFLNVSRPHLCKLVDTGVIPHEMVGRHRRVRATDLFEYKRKRDQTRAEALDELAVIDSDTI